MYKESLQLRNFNLQQAVANTCRSNNRSVITFRFTQTDWPLFLAQEAHFTRSTDRFEKPRSGKGTNKLIES
jgi:hypothetical protein